ncbi:hypothetical protein [Nostoc sp.]|uniref:hypothetical protein n=1 Tax=Nostoc sp. TaxID=1180 RepID=UPI003592F2F3
MTSIIISRLGDIDEIRQMLLTALKETEENLLSNETLIKFKGEFAVDGNKAKLNRYFDDRTEFILAKRRLQDALILSIAERLEKLNKDLELGIENLNKELKKLDNTITILETVERVIGIISRIVLLAR